jgi:uncharacterized oligopeptide transporter (OPT) family protein
MNHTEQRFIVLGLGAIALLIAIKMITTPVSTDLTESYKKAADEAEQLANEAERRNNQAPTRK